MTDGSPFSRRFLAVLESLRLGPQLRLGRRLARAGHVRELTISSSVAVAVVRGPEMRPHRARIAVRAFGAADWARVERALAGQARYLAHLLSGRMPADIERLFASLGLELFPGDIGDLAMDCSCDDWQVPCPHLAAACHVLADSFDTDPFGILAWRGRGRDELLERLRELRSVTVAGSATGGAARSATGAGAGPAPLTCDVGEFFTGGPLPAPESPVEVAGTVRRPDVVLDQLDAAVVGEQLVAGLRPLYRAFGRV